MANQNKSLGRFHLDGVPPAPRGVPQIEVTFDIDANGILHVSAKDKGTGKEQSIRIEASSGLSDEEIKKMKDEAEAHAEADKKMKEEVDKLNQADSLVFQTEKQLKEYGDKLPADKKAAIEKAAADLKEAHAKKDLAGIDTHMATLNQMWQEASQHMYQDQGQAGADPNAAQGQPNAGGQQAGGEDEVTDVDFEEVK
jgi:molecular chaperone DnaK